MEVHLISGVMDPWAWAGRAMRKAHAKGIELWVIVARDQWPHLMDHVCGQDPQAFLPLAPPDASESVRHRSCVKVFWADVGQDLPPPATRLLNLAPQMHPNPALFAGVVDCVAAEESAAQAGRQRYRRYQHLGFKVIHKTDNA